MAISIGGAGTQVETVFNANTQSLIFDSKTPIVGTGVLQGDIVRFNNVITIGGQGIDAVVTTQALTNVNGNALLEFDSTANPPGGNANFLQPTMQTTGGAAGGGARFSIEFFKAGTYTGVGTGQAVTLQNVAINAYDVDSTGGGNPDRRYQVFKGFASYELIAGSFLTPTVLLTRAASASR